MMLLSEREATVSWKVRTGKDRYFFSNLWGYIILFLRKIQCTNREELTSCGKSVVLRIEFLRTIHSLMLYPKFPWCRIWKPVMPSSLCVPRTLKPREGMWLHQDCGRVSTTTRSPHLPTVALFHENVLSSVSVLYRQEGNEYFVLSLLLLKKKNTREKHFLRLSNKDFLLRSYLINEREENGLQQSPCQSKERERELSVPSATTLSLFPQSWLCLSSNCAWPSVKLNENLLQVSRALLLRKALSQFLEGKGKRKIKNTKQSKHYPHYCHIWNMKP